MRFNELTEDDKTELNSILNDLRTAHKDQDTIKIDSEMEKLNESWNILDISLEIGSLIKVKILIFPL